jgi:hypothetical protein
MLSDRFSFLEDDTNRFRIRPDLSCVLTPLSMVIKELVSSFKPQFSTEPKPSILKSTIEGTNVERETIRSE